MKKCPNCNSNVEDNFDLCWQCNYSFTDKVVVDIIEESQLGKKELECLRCNTIMQYAGAYKFHEGASPGIAGSWFEIFQNKVMFDIYACPQCGKVEFYIPERIDKKQ